MTTYFNPITQQIATSDQVLTNPNINFAVNAPDTNYVPITEVTQPAFDPILESISQGFPTLTNGVYTQVWVLTPNNSLQQQAMLGALRIEQIATLATAYQNAIVQPVSFTTAAGVTKAYQADLNSQNNLLLASTGYTFAGATPPGFFWVASDNSQVPFTLPDLHGLYLAMLSQGELAFAHLQTQKVAVNAATTAAAVQAINW